MKNRITIICLVISTIINAQSIVPSIFYGYDFSNFKCIKHTEVPTFKGDIDVKKEAKEIHYCIIKWTEMLNNYFNSDKFAPTANLVAIEKKCIDMNIDNIITSEQPTLNIAETINKYELTEKEGYGIVVIIDNINKIENTATCYFVEFDIKTRDILYNEKSIKDISANQRKYGYWVMGRNCLINVIKVGKSKYKHFSKTNNITSK